MAVLGPYAGVNMMNVHNNIHSQLTKSLEKILEDAYLSGELKLSGRKLKEFPKPVKYDLSDTVVADLSKNRFGELPDEVPSFVYLEKLLLSQNAIRSVPDAVGGLQSLTYLDLSSNQLTELPRGICQMPLQVLLVNNNMLTSLPKDIGRMTSLAELDASNNRLTQVPMTLGDCGGLKALDLSNNQLGLLPLQITYLRLEHLDVSCNCISSLPLELRNMTTLVTLSLEHNPLVSPPTTVCMRGRVHIFKYLDNMANKDNVSSHRRLEDTRRGTSKHSSFNNPAQSHQIVSGNATIDCLRHKPRHVVDSGYCTDGVDKRWINDGGGDTIGGSGRSTPSTLSPGTALSRAQSLTQSLSSDSPITPQMSPLRISPEGLSNGIDKSKLAHQQTYRQYKEALRQQRQQDVYRPRTDQSSPDDSPQSLNPSPVHNHSPLNGYGNVSNLSPTLYRNITTSPQVPNSPLLHSTPRRPQNGNPEKVEENPKRPVQKVVPSRNVNKMYAANGNLDYRTNGDTYTKPASPTKSPTNTLGYNSLSKPNGTRVNGDAKALTTTVSYLKGAGPKPASKMPWNKEANDKLSFTMKREFDKQKEELDLLQQLRTILETRLKMSLPEQLAPVLGDGVVLCHLANHVRPRSVGSVHVPSPAQPKLTMARCRRNVDNFLEACRRIGVEEELICTPEDVLKHHPDAPTDEDRDISPLALTVSALLAHATATAPHSPKDSYPYYEEPSDNASDVTETSVEINYQLTRYREDRIVSNFNYEYQNTIYENEEFQYEYDNNNYYANEIRNRAPYCQTNRVQFVTPFCKDSVLRSEVMEIYDTDEVDFVPMEESNMGRYDRSKMNLEIENNLNTKLTEKTEEVVAVKREDVVINEEQRFMKLMCCAADILEGKGTVQVAITVSELMRRQGSRTSPRATPPPASAAAAATAHAT